MWLVNALRWHSHQRLRLQSLDSARLQPFGMASGTPQPRKVSQRHVGGCSLPLFASRPPTTLSHRVLQPFSVVSSPGYSQKTWDRYRDSSSPNMSFLKRCRWDLGVPGKLIPEWKKMLNPETIPKDLVSAASIFCVGVPLNLAIAIASNVPPQVAMVTAAVSAIPACLLGGTTLAVTGPAAAMSVLVAQAVNTHGLAALPFITLSVGAMQVISGVLNAGWIVKLTPLPVIAGFTTGVGVLIGSGQLPRLLALPSAGADASALAICQHVACNLASLDPLSLGIGALTLAVAKIVPKLHPKASGFATLAAVGVGTTTALGASVFGLGAVATVGAMPPLVLADLLRMPVAEDLLALAPTTFLIYVLCSVETLLSCTAIDKMRPTSYKHDASQELIGQGFANLASGAFSGMPVTSVIARSTLNVRSDGQTRLASIVHAVAVLGGLSALAPLISLVPMPTLAAVLLNAAGGMLWPPEAMHAIQVQRTDVMPYAATALGILSCGLAEGVLIGMATSLVFSGANWNKPETAWMSFKKTHAVQMPVDSFSTERLMEMSKEQIIQLLRPEIRKAGRECLQCDGTGTILLVMTSYDSPLDEDSEKPCPACNGSGYQIDPKRVPSIWAVHGPLNYLSVFVISRLIATVKQDSLDRGVRHIIDLNSCSGLDLTGSEELLSGLHELQKDGVQVTLMNVPSQFKAVLEAYKTMGEINAYMKHIPTAGLRPAHELAGSFVDPMEMIMDDR